MCRVCVGIYCAPSATTDDEKKAKNKCQMRGSIFLSMQKCLSPAPKKAATAVSKQEFKSPPKILQNAPKAMPIIMHSMSLERLRGIFKCSKYSLAVLKDGK